MKKGKLKNNFLFIVGISLTVIILFIVGFAAFYQDSSLTFNESGYIIYATENNSSSYSFSSGTKYKKDLNQDIAFSDVNNKSVSVDSASFVHYDNGSISFLQNGALLDLDQVDEDYVPYYNISNQILIQYDNGVYKITNDAKDLTLINWIGRISDSKYIVAGKNLSLKIPGVSKTIDGDYFELLFMTDGVVKIDNQDVSYQVTAQGSTIYVGDNIRIDLGENQIFYNNDSKMLLSQITISGDENINLDDGNGSGGGSGSGDGTSGVSSGVTSGTSGTGGGASGGGSGSGDGTSGVSSNVTSGTSGTGGGASGGGSGSGDGIGDGSGDGTGEGSGNGGSSSGEKTTASATIELIKLDVTATSMYATLQMNRSSLISGSLTAYLTDISTGQRVSANISKKDGTLEICSTGTDCYSFGTALVPDNQYLLSIIDINQNNQYFQKLITTSELGVHLERKYATSSSLSYYIDYSTNTSVSQLDFYLYDDAGDEVFKQVGIQNSLDITVPNLKPNTSYKAVMKNVSVCDDNNNCNFDEKYEVSRIDVTLKSAPVIESIGVKKNVDSASFDLSATVKDEFSTITKYIYTVCEDVSMDEEETSTQCFTKEKTDADALNIKVGEDIQSGVVYTYTFRLQYHDGQMEREVVYNGSSLFSMESLPYFQLSDKQATSNTISAKLSLIDPSCTVPILGRICRNSNNNFTLRYYKLVDGEEKKKDISIYREDFKYDESTGLYYYNLNLTNLASETKYVIKVYGTYFLNGEEYSNVQIGDELYVETTSTGNLKFLYTDNDSTDDAVINYNAKLSGGNTQDEEESLSALNSIEKLTFDLYAGTYADDSETNNRHLGETIVMTGNSNIRKNFCNADITSDVCNVSYNFTNGKFGLDSLLKLMKETGNLNNFCNPKESFGCLATSYTVVVKGYDSAGNEINIDNNTYTYNITPAYYVTTQLNYHTDKNKKAIVVDKIVKEEFKTGDSYDFENIIKQVKDELKDLLAYKGHLKSISDDTIVGIQVHARIPQNYINSAYKYDKVVTNYYVCKENEENCNSETAISTYSVENTNYSDSSYIVYLNDSDFVRGYTYKVMYELVFTLSDGTESVYSNNYTSIDVSIPRQAPIYSFYIVNSTKNTITYGYYIKDVDGAIDKNDYFFYYSIGEDQTKRQGDSYTLEATDDTATFTFCNENETCNGTNYQIYLKEKLLGDKGDYVLIDNTTFDGEYAISSSDQFHLLSYASDNRLYIQLNDDELGDRTALYRVRLKDNSSSVIYDKYYLASQTESCSLDAENDSSVVCKENPGNYKYLTVDYANKDVAENIGKDITVSVDSYYDSGLVGIRQKFNDGLILQNMQKKLYLNIYVYTDGVEKKTEISEKDFTNGIYMIDGSTKFDADSVTLYHKLGLSSLASYSKQNGAIAYSKNTSLINKKYIITYSKNGVQFGNYSNYNPKVVSISYMSCDENKFSFDSIIPKVTTKENRGINSLGIDFQFSSVSSDTLSSQFKNENGKYYLYVNLYDGDGNDVVKDKKVEINLDNGTSTEFTDLDVETNYKYDIWAYLKKGDDYTKVQVYDGSSIDYVKTTYQTSTLSKDELLSKVVFKANAVGYNNNGESISDKKISYNVKVTNGKYLKIRLGLYDKDGNLVNFDGTSCINEVNCYVEISDASHSILSNSDAIKEYPIFNNNAYVFGNGYYTLKVFAIPYYSSGYDTDNMLTLYNDVLITNKKGKVEFDVHELQQADFSISKFESGYNDNDQYYIDLVVGSVKDPDYVMKNGEYNISLYDDNGDVVYTVKNESNKTVLIEAGTNNKTILYEKANLYSSSGNVYIKFPKLYNNRQYSIELSYDTYRNNVSFGNDEVKKKTVNPYTDYIYTPISEGITLGNVLISKISNTSFKLLYDGSNGLESIKRVEYTVKLKGSSYLTSGFVKGNSIFTKSDNNYSLNINLTDFTFETSGTYNVSIAYYTDEYGHNKIDSSTFSILV